jgi:hypothetical protein
MVMRGWCCVADAVDLGQLSTTARSEAEAFTERLTAAGYSLFHADGSHAAAITEGSEAFTFCPRHESDGKHEPSLSVTIKNSRVLCYCHPCGESHFSLIMAGSIPECAAEYQPGSRANGGGSWGNGGRRLVAGIEVSSGEEYADYCAAIADGYSDTTHYYGDDYAKVKWERQVGDGQRHKSFTWYRRLWDRKWARGLNGEIPPLYGSWRLNDDEVVYAVEGEKDADALHSRGINAVSSVYTGTPDAECLRGRHVVIIPDNDQAGADHAATFQRVITGITASTTVAKPLGTQRGYDVSDWLADGHGVSELPMPAEPGVNADGGNGNGNGDDGGSTGSDDDDIVPAGYSLPPHYRIEVEDDGSGHVIWNRPNARGPDTPVIIAHRPLVITGMSSSSDGQSWYTLTWLSTDGSQREAVLSASDIASSNALLSLGDLVVTKSTVNLVAKYLAELTKQNAAWLESRKEHIATQLGWQDDNATPFVFGPGRPCQVSDAKSTGPWLAGHREEGRLSDWVACAKSLRHRPHAQAMISSTFAAPLLRPLKLPSFAVDISGGSSGGKTILMSFAAAAWGDPSAIIQSWKDTGAAVEHFLAMARGIPVFTDETQLVRDASQVEAIIYGLTQGKSKARSRQDGSGLLPVTQWESVLMATGEKPLTTFTRKSGVIPRSVSFAGTPLGSAEEANTVRDVASSSFGLAGPAFLAHVMKLHSDELVKRHQALESEVAAAAADRLAARKAGSIAVMKLANQLAAEAGLMALAGDDVWLWLVSGGDADADGDGSIPRKALRDALTWAQSNAHRFIGHSELILQYQEALGCWRLDGRQPYISFVPVKLDEFLAGQGYDAEAIRLAWRDEGWIVTKDGKTSVPVHVRGSEKPRQVKVIALDDIINDTATDDDEAAGNLSARARWAAQNGR